MAQDDIEVIMYKILRYLYDCMKAGKRPRAEDMCYDCQMFTINERYWYHIMNSDRRGQYKRLLLIRSELWIRTSAMH